MSETDRLLGELLGEVKGINVRLDRINGRLDNHGKRLGSLEETRSTARGAAWMGGLIGGMLSGIGVWLASNLLERRQ